MAILTDARNAVWSAIDNYASLNGAFNQKFRYDKEQSTWENIEPSISDLSAIAIVPINMSPEWWTNRMQNWPYVLDVTLWTKNWHLEPAEELIEKVILAMYRATPSGSSVPYIKKATGYHPTKHGPATFQASRLTDAKNGQGTKVIITRMQVSLRIHRDPFGDDA